MFTIAGVNVICYTNDYIQLYNTAKCLMKIRFFLDKYQNIGTQIE